MNVLDLFSGIGGFSLGLERAGMRTVAFCECDPYCRAVLRRHWPDVPVHDDVRTVPAIGNVDLVCGGFPCQSFSSAARGRHRHANLWPAMFAVVARERPAWIVVENVVNLDGMALAEVVSDLEGCGYAVAPPLEIPACAVGYDHWRPRLWLLGHANRKSQSECAIDGQMARLSQSRSITGSDRASDGISNRLDRLGALGNALVPQIAEIIGRAILQAGGSP
jgi:DNA (cytosine-5)-methyltransferase 1